MSTTIVINDDGRSGTVNGKNVHKDDNDRWIATNPNDQLTAEESRRFWYHISSIANKPVRSHMPFAFCRIGKITPAS